MATLDASALSFLIPSSFQVSSRAIIHRIQLPQFLHARLNHLLHLSELGDICNGHAGLAAHALNFFGDFFTSGLVGCDVVDADVVAIAGQAEGNGFADAARGAGDYCCFTGNCSVHTETPSNWQKTGDVEAVLCLWRDIPHVEAPGSSDVFEVQQPSFGALDVNNTRYGDKIDGREIKKGV